MNDGRLPKIAKGVKNIANQVKEVSGEAIKGMGAVKGAITTGISTSKEVVQKANLLRKSVIKKGTLSKGVEATSKGAKFLAKGAGLASKGAKRISDTMEKTSDHLQQFSDKLKK